MSLLNILIALASLALCITVEGCQTDGSAKPDCTQWTDPEHPFYAPHEYDCTKFWQCSADLTPCLMECAPAADGESLFFNPELSVCDWPQNVDCTPTTTTTTTTPATTAASTCSYVLEKNVRYPTILWDIAGKLETATADACQELCDGYEECVAYTWNGDGNGSCYLRSRVVMKWFKLGAVSGKKVCE